MENQDKLHEQFKEAAGRAEQKDFARMEAVWNRVEEKLDNKKQRRIAAWWKYTGMAAVFLLFMGVGFFMLTNEKNNPVVAPKVTPENTVTTIDTQKVKQTFDPAKAVEKEAVVTTVTKTAEAAPMGVMAAGNDIATPSEPGYAAGDLDKGYEDDTSTKDMVYKEKIKPVVSSKKMISGIITDSQGMPVPGVNVMIEGTSKGTQTDFDGKYMIDAKEGEKIVASFVGMQTQVVTLNKSKSINFKLQDDATQLDEVVVEAYRTTTRAQSNVAVTTITSKTIEGRPQSRAERKKAKKEAEAAAKSNVTVGANYTIDANSAVATTPSRTYRDGDQQS